MSQALRRRLARLEQAILDATPPAPWGVVVVPLGADPEPYRAAHQREHPGQNLVLVHTIDGRKPAETVQ